MNKNQKGKTNSALFTEDMIIHKEYPKEFTDDSLVVIYQLLK